MAAELDMRANGVASIFSVKKTPWHQEGTVLADSPSLAEALHLGGLDFEVELRPLTARVEIREGEEVDVPVSNRRAVVRTDRHEVLGVVGSSYRALQNADAFRVLEPLLDGGIASLETGGSLRRGRDVWMMVKFNLGDANVWSLLKDEVQPYALISNNHDGTRGVTLQETPVRVVCANTLAFALRDLSKAVAVAHTTNVKIRLLDAATELFGNVLKRYQVIANQYALLKATVLAEIQFAQLVLDVVAPRPEAPANRPNKLTSKAYDRAMIRAEARRDRLCQLWTAGDGHVGDSSAWEAYNAAIQSLDHDAGIWVSENRLASLFDGRLARTKQLVTESLIGFCMSARSHTG